MEKIKTQLETANTSYKDPRNAVLSTRKVDGWKSSTSFLYPQVPTRHEASTPSDLDPKAEVEPTTQ